MIEAGIIQMNVIMNREFFDIFHEWTYDEVLKIWFDGSYSCRELGESVFVGTFDTGFDFGEMKAVHKNTIVGKTHSLILLKS